MLIVKARIWGGFEQSVTQKFGFEVGVDKVDYP